jgi:hypothetical protein
MPIRADGSGLRPKPDDERRRQREDADGRQPQRRARVRRGVPEDERDERDRDDADGEAGGRLADEVARQLRLDREVEPRPSVPSPLLGPCPDMVASMAGPSLHRIRRACHETGRDMASDVRILV